MGEYHDLAKDIVKNVGGKENVAGLVHCITRLRFTLKDESRANDEILKAMDGHSNEKWWSISSSYW